MAWTSPRTWTTGELVTASMLNTHLRDNQLYSNGAGGNAKTGPLSLTGPLANAQGTGEDHRYLLFQTSNAGQIYGSFWGEYSTTGLTNVAKTVMETDGVASGLICINGDDGTNFFSDVVMWGRGAPVTLGSSASGAPPSRTYTNVGLALLKCQLGSAGNYKTTAILMATSPHS